MYLLDIHQYKSFMNAMNEFDSEFCNVIYNETDRVVLLSWKKFCCYEDYRKPTLYALELLKLYPGSSLVVDARNGFEDDPADVEWGFTELLPAMAKTNCKNVIFIMSTINEIQAEMDLWSKEFMKYFNVRWVNSYTEAVQVDRQILKRSVKRITNRLTGGVLLYELIMFIVTLVYAIAVTVSIMVNNKGAADYNNISKKLTDILTSSGIPFFLSIFIGLPLLWLFLRKLYPKKILFQSKKKMTTSIFLMLTFLFMSTQIIFTLLNAGFEALLNHFGFSALKQLEMISDTSTTVSMFLYVSFLGPIAEEIIFRGFLLRSLERYGKLFAIVISSVAFGALHGNFIQGFSAMTVGLVLGYVAMEYSIRWSIVLHIINNFIFFEVLTYMTSGFSDFQQAIIEYAIEIIFFIGALIIIFMNKDRIRSFVRNEKTRKGFYQYAFSSVCMIVYLVVQLLLSIFSISRI